MSKSGPDILTDLYKKIYDRKGTDPKTSYTAKLFDRGPNKIAQKVGEEAVEVVIAALVEKKGDLAEESADLLYHLLVLWAQTDLDPTDVWAALARRQGTSGLDEKAGRKGKS